MNDFGIPRMTLTAEAHNLLLRLVNPSVLSDPPIPEHAALTEQLRRLTQPADVVMQEDRDLRELWNSIGEDSRYLCAIEGNTIFIHIRHARASVDIYYYIARYFAIRLHCFGEYTARDMNRVYISRYVISE